MWSEDSDGVFSYVRRGSFEIKKLNVDDEFSGQWNLKSPDEVVVALELLISNFCT